MNFYYCSKCDKHTKWNGKGCIICQINNANYNIKTKQREIDELQDNINSLKRKLKED